MKPTITLMKRLLVLLVAATLFFGCPAAQLEAPNPAIFDNAVVVSHKRVRVSASKDRMVDTGVDVRRGQLFSVFASGEIRKWLRGPAVGPGSARLNYSIDSDIFGLALWGADDKTWSAPSSGRSR